MNALTTVLVSPIETIHAQKAMKKLQTLLPMAEVCHRTIDPPIAPWCLAFMMVIYLSINQSKGVLCSF